MEIIEAVNTKRGVNIKALSLCFVILSCSHSLSPYNLGLFINSQSAD